jgi:class 3 adenylate cyclase
MSTIENLTIMFTDIVGFSNMVSTLSRSESEQILHRHDKLLQKVIRRFGGKIIKSVGDSFLVVFRSPTDAVLCSMAMQDALWEMNIDKAEPEKIIIRIALNAGEVRLTSNDVFGDAVNIAARLESETPAGAIYLTETVYLSMNKNEVCFEEKGKYDFKGIPHAITVYQASHKKTENLAPELIHYPYGGAHINLKPASRKLLTFGRLFIGLGAAIVAAFITWWVTINYMPTSSTIDLDKLEVEYRNSDSITDNDIATFLPDITTEIRGLAEPLITNKNYLQLQELVNTYQTDYPDNAYLMALQAHVDMYNKNYESAIKNYAAALENNASLARDAILSNNLVDLLDAQRLKANRLIARYLSQPMLDALAKRSGQKGLRGRYDAFYLLKDSGNMDRIDKVGLNIWDLRELNECPLKRVAVNELKRLNDPKALPALNEIMDVGLIERFKYSCLRRDTKEAIEQLQATDKKEKKPK